MIERPTVNKMADLLRSPRLDHRAVPATRSPQPPARRACVGRVDRGGKHHINRSRTRTAILVRTSVAIGVSLMIGAPVGASPASAPSASPIAALPATTLAAPLRNATTEQRITQLEASVRAAPKNGSIWLMLGSAYVRRAYETADPAYYPLAENALGRAGTVLSDPPEVLSAKATLALARHRFADARVLVSRVLRDRPASLEARLSLFDANIELGDYTAAAAEIEDLVDQRPGVATLSRLSYLRQLNGDLLGAELAMRQAVSAAPETSFDRAVALGYLGDVLMEKGSVDAAARAYDTAVGIQPFATTALLGQARVAMARNDAKKAAVILDRLTTRIPLPAALGLRADIARASGDAAAATAADQLVDASVKLFQANGAVVDAELALLLADRGPTGASVAVVAARRAYAERRTIFTADAMAWSLYTAGRAKEAEPFAREAIRSAPAVSSTRWHAAVILSAVGDEGKARTELRAAIRNPWFSLSQRGALLELASKLGVPQ